MSLTPTDIAAVAFSPPFGRSRGYDAEAVDDFTRRLEATFADLHRWIEQRRAAGPAHVAVVGPVPRTVMPDDITAACFPLARRFRGRGYHRQEVDAFLDLVLVELSALRDEANALDEADGRRA